MSDKFDVRSEILRAIGKTNDEQMKMVLLLMLGVLEEIGGKIDEFLRDEKTLRDKVLNGHEPNHHKHHDWVEAQMRVENARGPVCEWAKRKMLDEMEDANTKKTLKQQFWEAVVNQAGSIIVVAIATAVGVMSYLK